VRLLLPFAFFAPLAVFPPFLEQRRGTAKYAKVAKEENHRLP